MRNVRKFSMNTSGPVLTAFFRDHFPMLEDVEIHAQVVPPKGEADNVTAWLLELGVVVKVKRYSHMRMWTPSQWRRHKFLEQARSDKFPWRDCFYVLQCRRKSIEEKLLQGVLECVLDVQD